MAHKVGIPDYAMQPAKAVKTVEAKGCYDKTEFVCMGKQQQVSFRVEEDILVPDIKPDMENILSVKASCDISPRERSLVLGEDLVNWTGNISLQVVYKSNADEIIPLESQLPYKHQWKTTQESEADASFSCSVGNIDATIVNERKLRLSITVEVRVTYCRKSSISVLTSVGSDTAGCLQVKRQPVLISCLSTICKDEMDIVESFPKRDGIVPTGILRQDYCITENYKQITGDKIVLNGFVHVVLLYAGFDQQATDEREVLCQQYQRIEFTQFIPIPKSARGRDYSFTHVELKGKGFHTDIVSPLRGEQGEELSAQKEFQTSGVVETKVVLFEKNQTDIAVDAYHTEKNLEFVRQPRSFESMNSSSVFEINTRDSLNIANPPASVRSYDAGLFGYCSAESAALTAEGDRIALDGSLLWQIGYRDKNGACQIVKERLPFHAVFELDSDTYSDNMDYSLAVKCCEVDFAGEGQIEVRAQLVLSLCSYVEYQVLELVEPVFIEGLHRKSYPLVIASIGPGETLWDVAKRHSTTVDSIRQADGGRLLIMK